MTPIQPIQLGKVQAKIFRILCERGRASAREITDVLNEAAPTAHSTVQTLLRTLEAKGAVSHDVEGRTFIFYPLSPSVHLARERRNAGIGHGVRFQDANSQTLSSL